MLHVRHVLHYLGVVGLPLLGLVVVLEAGRDLSAPIAVRGTYRIMATEGTAASCVSQLLADSTVTITQSGGRVQIRLSDAAVRLDGWLAGIRVEARGGCSGGEPVRFTATAARVDRQMVLHAQVGPDCAGWL
jgi:hypothetical protein